jgi:Uncharacterised nucleotidyltransferase
VDYPILRTRLTSLNSFGYAKYLMNRIAEALCAALREPGHHEVAAPDALRLTPAEWHQVAALAIRQRVGPLLHSLTHLPVPDEVRAVLRASAERSARRVLLQQAAFRQLAAAVAPLGVTLVALKGIHLASAVYTGPTLREMADIDVLTPVDQLQAVSEVAKRLGYTVPPLGGASHHHLPMMVRGRVGLELHWQLAPGELGVRADVEGLLQRAVALDRLPGAKGLCTEDLLLHTCLHAADHHVFEMGLRSLCDVQAIVAREGHRIDWRTLMARSRAWGTERGLALVLTLAHRHLGVPVPDLVLQELHDALPPQDIVTTATNFVLEDALNLGGASEAASELLTLGSHGERMRHIAKHLLKPGETHPESKAGRWRHVRTVPALVTRAVGLAWRHGGWLWRASREKDSPLRDALDTRNTLAEWIRGR